MSDDRPPTLPPLPPTDAPQWARDWAEWLRRSNDTQKRLVKAVTNLALGLASSAETDKARHDQLIGILLADVSEKRAERKRRDSGNYSEKFALPGGNNLELTGRTQHTIIKWLLRWAWIFVLFVGTHVAHYLLAKTAIDQAAAKSTPIAVPVPEPQLQAPKLTPPALPPHTP